MDPDPHRIRQFVRRGGGSRQLTCPVVTPVANRPQALSPSAENPRSRRRRPPGWPTLRLVHQRSRAADSARPQGRASLLLPRRTLLGGNLQGPNPPESPWCALAPTAPRRGGSRTRQGASKVNEITLLSPKAAPGHVNQARLAFEAWFGTRPEITPGLLKAVAATF